VATSNAELQRLRANERRYRTLVQHAADVIVELSPKGTVSYASPAFYRLLGFPQGAWTGRAFTDLVHADDRAIVAAWVKIGTHSSTRVPVVRVRTHAGMWRLIEGSVNNLLDDPDVGVLIATFRDVTDHHLADERLRFHAAILDAIGQAVVATDLEGRITYWNRAAEAMYGWSETEAFARPGVELLAGGGGDLHSDEIVASLRRGETWRGELDARRKDGSLLPVSVTTAPVCNTRGELAGVITVSSDVTERQRLAEAGLVRSQRQLVVAQRLSMTGSWDLDLLSGSARWSEQLFRILGFREGQVVPSFMALLAAVHPEDRAAVAEARSRALARAGTQEHQFRVVRRDGSVGTMLATIEAAFGENGAPVRLTGAVQDVTERTVLEGALERQSFYDGLTGLANRALFMDRLAHALQRRGRLEAAPAVLLVDLEEFRAVNDSLGHVAGDELLVTVARRLVRIVRPSDTVARLGGDEFAVLLESADQPAAEQAAQRILAAIDLPMQAQGHEVFVHACVGIAAADDVTATSELLRHAELALHSAQAESKRQGHKSRRRVFDPSMHLEARRRLDLRRELQMAVDRAELLLRYQPIVRLDSGRIVAVEALVRWQHPAMGIVSPADFIPMAEESGLIVPIGGWVLQEAVGWIQTINAPREAAQPVRGLNVSVNLSPRQLAEPNLQQWIQEALTSSGLDPRRLVIEITESVLVEDADTVVPVLGQLRDQGVRVAVDDFGTGYSSLSYLRRLPIDVLKIDRSFVGGITEAAEDAAVARAVVKLAEALSLATVAEGIETPEQAQALADLGCTHGQGYLFSLPVVPAEIEEMLRAEEAGLDGP
jgi:diguanylate cyclase (GGDEF)-like protein/PAS domain S-box-containing protein